MIRKPLVKMVGAREALIEYESEDDEVNYKYSHRFRLLNSGRIAYDETVRLYERHGHHFLETAEQHSLLMRLTNIEEWHSFVRPAPDDVREGEISTSKQLRSSFTNKCWRMRSVSGKKPDERLERSSALRQEKGCDATAVTGLGTVHTA
jgi:hypothetical protein